MRDSDWLNREGTSCLVMNGNVKKLLPDFRKNRENFLAPEPGDVLAFRKYTECVWSKVTGRPISEKEADQIIEDFGQFLRALAKERRSQ